MIYQKIHDQIENLDFSKIPTERKEILDQMAQVVSAIIEQGKEVKLNFICTHNSRRSHLAQVWTQTLASYYKIPGILCFSGGTDATAIYPSVLKTVESQGFKIEKQLDARHLIRYSDDAPAVVGFSKVYNDDFNPQTGYIGVMVCDDAYENCPLVFGMDHRFGLTFTDPKHSDGSAQEAGTYAATSLLIASQMKYFLSLVK